MRLACIGPDHSLHLTRRMCRSIAENRRKGLKEPNADKPPGEMEAGAPRAPMRDNELAAFVFGTRAKLKHSLQVGRPQARAAMDPLLVVVSAVLGPLVVYGFFGLRRSLGRDMRFSRRPGPQGQPKHAFVIGVDRAAERLVRTPPLVSLPVSSLAGLPISRPVLEGRLGKRKYGNREGRRRAVRPIVSGDCPACRESRARGRNYCLDCGRRLTRFLS